MRKTRYLLIVWALLAAMGWTQSPGEKDFEKGLKAVENLLARGQWKSAKRRLDKALTAHEGQIYAKVRLPEIERIARRVAYRLAHPPKSPKSLISGKLLSWNPKTGKIKLRYTNDRDSMEDFVRQSGYRFHPMRFNGPFSVTVKGKAYGKKAPEGPTLLLADGRKALRIGFGTSPNKQAAGEAQWYPADLSYFVGDRKEKTLDNKRIPPVPMGKKFKLNISVKAQSVVAKCNGKPILNGKKPRDFWGIVGFKLGDSWTDIELAGIGERGWLERLRDEAEQKDRVEFEKSFRPRQVLPSWLYEETPAASTTKEPKWPGHPDERETRRLEKIARWVDAKQPHGGLKALREVPALTVPDAARAYLKAQLLRLDDRPEEALSAIKECTSADPSFVPGRIFEARLLAWMGEFEKSTAIWDELKESHPHHPDVARFHAARLLLQGRADEAKAVIQKALAAGAPRSSLESMHRAIVKAAGGPEWPQRYEVTTSHYVIASDIDKETCYLAGRVLEKAHTAYNAYVRRANSGKRKFRVFIFSGASSYTAYAKDTLGRAMPGSVGLYSPLLKQLLIQNDPRRAEMFRTIRHEGFHQYLDRFASNAPLWFNEGHAAYFETAGDGGSWKAGVIRDDYLDILKERAVPTIESILTRRGDSFYKRGVRSYAESWALVHFLYHGKVGGKQILSKIFEQLGTRPAKTIVEDAFDSVDRVELEAKFRAYVEKLFIR